MLAAMVRNRGESLALFGNMGWNFAGRTAPQVKRAEWCAGFQVWPESALALDSAAWE